MRRGRALSVLLACAVGIAAGAVGAPVSAHAGDRSQVQHPLEVIGGEQARIVDDLGRTVILRGVNSNQLGEYYQEWPDLPATVPLARRDFAQMAKRGFNVVRLIVSWSRLEPERGQFNRRYLARIARALRWAAANDVYVLLDMHQDAWGPHVFTPDGVTCPPPLEPAVGWDGAPLWATALAGTAATCRGAGIREVSLAVGTSFQNFYDDADGIQSRLVATWAALARRFASRTVVAGYDLLNEPNPGLVPGSSDSTLLGAYYGRVIGAIRVAERERRAGFAHVAFFEPAVLNNNFPDYPLPPPDFTSDRQIVFAPHLYNESINPAPGTTIESGFAAAERAASVYGTTFFSGEWGWFGDPESDTPKIARYAATEDRYMVGGTWWQWKQACGDPHAIGVRGHRPDCAAAGERFSDGFVIAPRAWKRILSRAYPRAAPGELESIEADVESGALVVEGRADRAGVRADLWVPARCRRPAVSGRNLRHAHRRRVPGGWRIAVPVRRPSAYRIEVDC